MSMEDSREGKLTLVTTKPCFGLPTDQIPYVESGRYVAYNNEKGGVIDCLREDGIVDLDSDFRTIPEWISMKAMVSSWLVDALVYELWVASDKTAVQKIYFSDLAWPIGTILHLKQSYAAKLHLGVTSENAERIETEIYSKASLAYGALSTQLGDGSFLFGDRPSSLDALFLGHTLIALQVLPDASVLKSKLLNFSNLVKYTEKLSTELIDPSAQSAVPAWSRVPSSEGNPSTSTNKSGGFSNWSSKPKSKPKKERTEEEKKFRRRAKYFLTAQLVSVLVFLSLFGGSDAGEVDFDEGDEGIDYYD
ncbi:Mitochondrial outer membrane import complex protein METAXIN [Bienertia sinuspersici]